MAAQAGAGTAEPVHRKQPPGLALLFGVEMWERFSYYGMRALLVLYLVNALNWSPADASHLYGTFTSLVYLTPLVGGWLADRWIGTRRSLVVGGVVIAAGNFSMAAAHWFGLPVFYLGLGLIVIGTGFFKPNVSTMVGQLYEEHDPRRDAGFTIFYMGINLGAFLAPLVAGYLGERVGWWLGFGAPGVGMLLGLLMYLWGKDKYLPGIGLPRAREKDAAGQVKADAPLTREEKERVAVIFLVAFFVIFFWSAYEQAGASLNIFADRHTDRVVAGFEVPASWFQSVNPLAILLFAPVFAWIWTWLGRWGKEPATPVKMALGLLLLSSGFLLLVSAGHRVDAGVMVSPLWLVGGYVLHTWGELCLSPIGLSLVTKLAPVKFASLLMGVWFLANAASNKIAGTLSALMPVTDGTAPASAFDSFADFFMLFVVASAAAGLILLLLSPMLKRMMHGRG